MARIFGFDIGTTSIGFAVIDHDPSEQTGQILRLGVRIFPEARDPKGVPLNQERRKQRTVRRQLRRRKQRRRDLAQCLAEAGFLPAAGTATWGDVMKQEPVALRVRGLSEALTPYELGRALYHLAQRRHFKPQELEETEREEDADEKAARTARDSLLQCLKASGETLGQHLLKKGKHERQRGLHALRSVVEDEFNRLWDAQSPHHAPLRSETFRAQVAGTIFHQRPVFWRRSTLGVCPFMPDEKTVCARGSWLSQQRRMLEKLNNLAVEGGNSRPLDEEERAAVLARLQVQASMTWGGVRDALKPIYQARGEPGVEKKLRFNLEQGGDKALPGNGLETKLSAIFGKDWPCHPQQQQIRDAIHPLLWAADYGELGDQRIVIRSEADRRIRRAAAQARLVDDFGVTTEQAAALSALRFPSGWEPYSAAALMQFLPHLQAGVRLGALLNGPEWHDWRAATFPDRATPGGAGLDRLPSPAYREEQKRLASLRNPTVIRVQNELRKVCNNLLGLYGKPDLIRIELAREVGKSQRERQEMREGQDKMEARRKTATKDLEALGVNPSRANIEKQLLWRECGGFDPYSGLPISCDALFGTGEYDIEHIWPQSKYLDNSFGNKTLCLKALNHRKGDRTPFEAFGHDPEWPEMKKRIWALAAARKMAKGKAKRFCREEPLDQDFTNRQLNDTGFAARQAMTFLQRLWPNPGTAAPVTVQAVSGKVTSQLRRLWCLNNILADDGEKTRADHRHHAVDALVVACGHQGLTQRLSRYWQAKADPGAARPQLDPPWRSIRKDADRAVAEIVVSHRVRRKVSGQLHKGTIYGDTGVNIIGRNVTYRQLVVRKKVEELSAGEVNRIRDAAIRKIVKQWIEEHGGEARKAFNRYPTLGEEGPEIRKVRLLTKQQSCLLAKLSTGFADLGSNHHLAIFRLSDGQVVFDSISLSEAARRVAKHEKVMCRSRDDGAVFLMSLSAGDTITMPGDKVHPTRMWRVQKIASKGQVSLLDLADASKEEVSLFEPMVGGIISRQAIKLSVDPIGRIRPAND